MKRRDQDSVAKGVRLSPQLGDALFGVEEELRREVAERDDDLRLDQRELLFEPWPARVDLVGLTDEFLFPPGTAASFRENDRKALETGTSVQTVETLRQGDGVVHHSLVSKFPVFGDDGKVTGIGGMAFDITDRVRAEDALREGYRRKDEFLATLAHELRNPLAPIRNAVAILGRKGSQDPEVAWSQGVIERQIESLTRLIDDLLDIERISRGKFELRREPVPLETVIDMALEASRPQVNAAGHHLSGRAIVKDDPTAVKRVVEEQIASAEGGLARIVGPRNIVMPIPKPAEHPGSFGRGM